VLLRNISEHIDQHTSVGCRDKRFSERSFCFNSLLFVKVVNRQYRHNNDKRRGYNRYQRIFLFSDKCQCFFAFAVFHK
jgi:hypothetical protein